MKSQHDLNGYMDDPAECGYYDEYTAYDWNSVSLAALMFVYE